MSINQHASEIEFLTRPYVRAHGKMPRGTGSWAFCAEQHANANDYLDHTFWYNGNFADAKRAARAHFAKHADVFEVVVLS